ncbi:hypothetical protein SUGI_0450800 [Cryptomeria japonica]|uniref:transcriptional regulator STERILE APETALA n=1 Tax=Cryptomeria japonica TaxID=3369 RepID=UPI002408BC60|nr:transcriptional regulator STERILE APETALA [Cryptomeria japonica]GLJ23764.1 hypothetical protein SUGI_0450800 [Cryptomeria japonica]
MSPPPEKRGASSAQPHLGRRRHNSEEGEASSSSAARSLRPESHEVEVSAEDDNEGLVWPEPFVEAVARKVALAAAQGGGALAAAPALVTVFQVCSTWRTISHSEILWEALVQDVWEWDTSQTTRRPQSWRDEYIRLHSTASNFRHNRAKYTLIEYEVSSDSSGNGAGAVCRCLTLSPEYLAVGFFDGAVRIFSLTSKECVNTMKPPHENRLGPLSRAISGIVINDDRVVFASFDGNVFVGEVLTGLVRRAHVGNVVNDGTLVDFTGSEKFWVGLYAGIPGHACHIWDAVTEQLVFNAGDITDSEALRGWRLLTEQAERIGRVRVNRDGILLTATRFKVTVFDLESYGVSFRREEIAMDEQQQLIVESVDANNDWFLTASDDGAARIRRITDFEDSWAFSFAEAAATDANSANSTTSTSRSSSGNTNSDRRNRVRVFGALNTRQAFLCIEGSVHAWDAKSGMRLYRLDEWMGEVFDLVADDEHVAGCAIDTGIHLWSFRP